MDYYLENTKIFKALGDQKRAMIVDMLSCRRALRLQYPGEVRNVSVHTVSSYENPM